MIKLKESQIWESEHGVIQIQKMGKNSFNFRGIVFEKKNNILNFVTIVYNEKDRLVNFIESLNMKEVNKKLIVKQREIQC